MLDGAHLRRAGKQLVEPTLPASRIVSIAEVTSGRPIEYRLDATANSTGRLGLGRPNRLKRLYDEPYINGLDRKAPERRSHVSGQSVLPLRCMLGISPSGTVRRNVA